MFRFEWVPHRILTSVDVLTQVDKTLQEQSEEYRIYRGQKKLDGILVYQLPAGTFTRFKRHLLKTTSVTQGQFKMPRVLKSSGPVEWLLKNIAS